MTLGGTALMGEGFWLSSPAPAGTYLIDVTDTQSSKVVKIVVKA